MSTQRNAVNTLSSAHEVMKPDWDQIRAIRDGARIIRTQGVTYLPQFPEESNTEYNRRRIKAPWRPVFDDILLALAAKPFGKEIMITAGETATIKSIVEDVDKCGHNLTQFAREAFENAIGYGFHIILVDFPPIQPGATLQAQRDAKAAPYWCHVRAYDVLAMYTAQVDGQETIVHIRMQEDGVEPEGYGEVLVSRIREFDRPKLIDVDPATGLQTITYGPAIWRLHEKRTVKQDNGNEITGYVVIGEGPVNRNGNTDIPIVVLYTGQRKPGGIVKPPLLEIADMQIELYRALSREDEVLDFAGSPMLCAVGMSAPEEGDPAVVIGPKRVLYCPQGDVATGWTYVQPAADNIQKVREKCTSIADEMRQMGMQPRTTESGNPTATATSIETANANAALKMWAGRLKDALEQAFVFTSEFLGETPGVELTVSTEFSIEPMATVILSTLDTARQRRDISQRTYWSRLQAVNVLAPDFSADDEEQLLADETEGLVAESAMFNAVGDTTATGPGAGPPSNTNGPPSNANNGPPAKAAAGP